jgi:hypothetical protein
LAHWYRLDALEASYPRGHRRAAWHAAGMADDPEYDGLEFLRKTVSLRSVFILLSFFQVYPAVQP